MKRVIVGITGASGVIYGIRTVEELKARGCEVHLVLTKNAVKVMHEETSATPEYLENLVDSVYSNSDLTAPIASGSFKADGMVVVPCSMATLSEIAYGISRSLISRAALVTLKENRKLVLVPRETPLTSIHLLNMLKLSRAGAVILPAMPAFYIKPETVNDLVNFVVGKILDQLGIKHELYRRYRDFEERKR